MATTKLKWTKLEKDDPTPFCGHPVRAGAWVGTYNDQRRAVVDRVHIGSSWWRAETSHSVGHFQHVGTCKRLDEAKAMANANAFPPDGEPGIWTLSIEDTHGAEVRLFTTEAKADAAAFAYLKERWSRALMGAMPSDLGEALEAFYAGREDTTVTIECLTVA